MPCHSPVLPKKNLLSPRLTTSALSGTSELYDFLGIAIYSVFSAAGSAAAAGAAAVSSLVASVAAAGAAAAPPEDSCGSASDDVQRVCDSQYRVNNQDRRTYKVISQELHD